MRKLPSLNAVRVFEAAARNGSFAGAAEELGITHAAVSRHVRNLEAELGVSLFERYARHVVLTGEGTLFARTSAEALSKLELGTGRLRRGGGRSTVVLDMESDLANGWLMPLLSDAALAELGVNLDLRVRPDPPRAVLGDADMAVTWGASACTGFKAAPFFGELQAFAVAAPSLAGGATEPGDHSLVLKCRLIHERGIYWWRTYFDALGMAFDDASGHLFFNRSHLCVEAAARGLGLAIGDDAICRDHFAKGTLISVGGLVLPARDRYYLLTPDTNVLSRPVRKVRDWLLEQARRTPRTIPTARAKDAK